MSGQAHYREAHPLVFVITHYINLICMIMLAFSGFYIHFPFFNGFMGAARGMHFVAMYVIVINLTFRIIAAFFVKTATELGSRAVDTDIKNWLPQRNNKHQFFQTIKYYLFFRKEGVISAKYGSLQKIAYLATIPLTYLQAFTGFAIYGPTMNSNLFSGAMTLVGGPMNMRIIHYFMMWVFIVFTMIHAYLANIYNLNPSKIIFLWKETEAKGY